MFRKSYTIFPTASQELEKFTQSLKQKRPKKPEFFRENKKIALNA